MTRTRFHVPTAVVAAMATAGAVGLASFPSIEARMSHQYSVLSTYPSDSLQGLVENHFNRTQLRFLLYVQLRDLAPGATITIPPDSRLSVEQLYGFSRASAVHVRSYDPVVDTDAAAVLMDAVTVNGEALYVGVYGLALTPGVTEIVLLQHNGINILADVALVPELPAGASG